MEWLPTTGYTEACRVKCTGLVGNKALCQGFSKGSFTRTRRRVTRELLSRVRCHLLGTLPLGST